MRRPLDWIVVSLSLMVLFANRMWAEPAAPARPLTQAGSLPVAPLASTPALTSGAGLFAYVHADGTQEFLPTPVSDEAWDVRFWEGVDRWIQAAAPATTGSDTHNAVLTWSSPLLVPQREPAAF